MNGFRCSLQLSDAPHVCTAFCRKPRHADLLYTRAGHTREELKQYYRRPGVHYAMNAGGLYTVVDIISAGEARPIAEMYALHGKEMPPVAADFEAAWVMILEPVSGAVAPAEQPELEYVR